MNLSTTSRKNVFYIPAGVPFVQALASAILDGALPCPNHQASAEVPLPNWTLLLPTRRATRGLMQAFIDCGQRSALLLPRIQPLGDVDEDELAFSNIPENLDTRAIPEAISNLERQFILYRLIHNWVSENHEVPLAQMLAQSAVHAFDLSQTLGQLVDSFETNGVDLKIIADLFDGEFAEHRQQILEFLAVIQKHLPLELKQLNRIGSSERRNRLMQAHLEFLKNGMASGPVIAAGSTGSIPATAELLSCIAGLENGAVILPGLDQNMDDESWEALTENHPQFGMRDLLIKMGLQRSNVEVLPGIEKSLSISPQNWLVSEIMRPADTTEQWRSAVTEHHKTLLQATTHITILDAEDQRSEAIAIALIMRQATEVNKSAALITPDRQLARNVKAELARWEIEIDDSAGAVLSDTPHAVLLRLIMECAAENFTPGSLKTLLTHPFCQLSLPDNERENLFLNFEIGLLRSDITYQSLDGLVRLCKAQINGEHEDHYAHPSFKRLTDDDWKGLLNFSLQLNEIFQPLEFYLTGKKTTPLTDHISTHLQVAEKISMNSAEQVLLWRGDAGEKLSEILSAMQAASHLAPNLDLQEYSMLLNRQLSETIIRPKSAKHPSLAILGLLEARLISSNIMILGGLNESIWPSVSDVDPWLTRPQLTAANLPVPERKTGLSAHDFAQGFCADKVYLTYAKKIGGSPAVPSRWILRLRALLQAAGAENACNCPDDEPWLDWVKRLDEPEDFNPINRPAPKPAFSLRPTQFSVTGIETLLKNPYALFAEKVLALKPLNDLDHKAGAAERGSLVHKGLQNFSERYPNQLPDNSVEELQTTFKELLAQSIPDTTLRVFWLPQLSRMAAWFIETEKNLRKNSVQCLVEESGVYRFTIKNVNYTLTARADRVDILDDGTTRIIDYKTGAPPSFIAGTKAFSPQLLLEAVISSHGGFENAPEMPTSQLSYIKLSGGVPAGEIKTSPKGLDQLIEETGSGMQNLLESYADPNQPYLANASPVRVDIEREYDYLSRWREWSHLPVDEDST